MDRLKAFFRKPVVFGLICFVLGAYSYWAVERLLSRFHFNAHYKITRNSGFPPFGGEDFEHDPFKQMEQMQRQMMKHFAQIPSDGEEDDDGFRLYFQNGPGATTLSTGEMKVREDDKFVYYDIDTGGATPTDFNIKVEDGVISISGTIEKKTDSTSISSSFQRSFPVPANTNARKVEFDNQNGKIILKFPKKA